MCINRLIGVIAHWQKRPLCEYVYTDKAVFLFSPNVNIRHISLSEDIFQNQKVTKSQILFLQTTGYQSFTKEKKIKNRIFDVTNIAFLIVPL